MATTLTLLVLSALAVGMSTLTAVIVRWAAFARRPLGAGTVQFLLAMMAGMFFGVLVYFAIGGLSGIIGGFWAAGAIMSASVFIVFLAFVKEAQSQSAPSEPFQSLISRPRFVASVVGLVIVNEFLMGWSFSLLSGALAPSLGASGADTLSILSDAITSPWFVFPMALEMLLTLRWLLAVLPRPMRPFLLIQPAIMICSPPTLGGLVWEVATAAAASVLMSVAVAVFLVALFRDEHLSTPVTAYAVRLILSFGLMSAGLFLWVEFSSPEVFALSLLVQMSVFLQASTDPASYSATNLPAQGPGVPTARSAETNRS
jgi:hypothetical protein